MKPYALVLSAACAAIALPALAQSPGESPAFGKSLQYDGTDDYVWCAPNASGLSEGTVEMWVRSDNLGTSSAIWTGGNGHPGVTGDWARLGTHSSTNGVSFGIYVPFNWRWAPSGQANLPTPWCHVAGTWGDASQRKGTHDYYNEAGLGTSAKIERRSR